MTRSRPSKNRISAFVMGWIVSLGLFLAASGLLLVMFGVPSAGQSSGAKSTSSTEEKRKKLPSNSPMTTSAQVEAKAKQAIRGVLLFPDSSKMDLTTTQKGKHTYFVEGTITATGKAGEKGSKRVVSTVFVPDGAKSSDYKIGLVTVDGEVLDGDENALDLIKEDLDSTAWMFKANEK